MSERFTRKESTYYEKAICRLQELEDKLENGTLIELPCKVGDTAWLLNDPYFVADIREIVVEDIRISRNGVTVYCVYDNEYCEFREDFIFKTKEKAEARLKELKEKKQ